MKFNQVLQSYAVKISSDETKAMAMDGRQRRRVKIMAS
jgi:hypothetical protein